MFISLISSIDRFVPCLYKFLCNIYLLKIVENIDNPFTVRRSVKQLICRGMKRKSEGDMGVGGDLEMKRSRNVNGSKSASPPSPSSLPSRGAKCPICLWPLGSPQCYHTDEYMQDDER